MKALDKLFHLSALTLAIAIGVFFLLELGETADRNLVWWVSNIIGVAVVSTGALSLAFALLLMWFALTSNGQLGVWLRLQLLFANVLKLYASALMISVGVRLGNWVSLPQDFLITRDILQVMAIVAILGLLAYGVNSLFPNSQRND